MILTQVVIRPEKSKLAKRYSQSQKYPFGRRVTRKAMHLLHLLFDQRETRKKSAISQRRRDNEKVAGGNNGAQSIELSEATKVENKKSERRTKPPGNK
jgi:hypothetical protein